MAVLRTGAPGLVWGVPEVNITAAVTATATAAAVRPIPALRAGLAADQLLQLVPAFAHGVAGRPRLGQHVFEQVQFIH
jgi:hypothetical protein